MGNLTLDRFDSAYRQMRGCFNEPEQPGGVDSNWPILRASLNLPALDHCVGALIASELDAQTPGERGLGRVSLNPPRLGGRYRRQIGSLEQADVDTLYLAIQHLVLSGYVGYALLMEDPPLTPVVTDADEIYGKWVPWIYSGGRPPRNVMDAVFAVTSPATESVVRYLGTLQVDGDAQPANMMLLHYVLAGVYLRGVEVGYAS